MTIDFTTQEEAWLNAQAAQKGLPPVEIIRRMVDERLPALSKQATAMPVALVIDAENVAAIAYLNGSFNGMRRTIRKRFEGSVRNEKNLS